MHGILRNFVAIFMPFFVKKQYKWLSMSIKNLSQLCIYH